MHAQSSSSDHWSQGLLRSCLFGTTVFLLCIAGILSRPGADLASFWPANAFMMGMLVRFPRLAMPMSWLACATGFALADAVTGSPLAKNVILNAGNLLAILAGYTTLTHLGLSRQTMASPASAFVMMLGVAAAATTAGVIGMAADPLLFGGRSAEAFVYWSATELVNYVAFLPMLLTLPERPLEWCRTALPRPLGLGHIAPVVTLLLTAWLGLWIGGPGAIAFPVLALLWCALRYSMFVTACLSLLFVTWTLVSINTGHLAVAPHSADRATLLSIRVAVSLIGIAPLVVASVMAAREELLRRFVRLSERDQMTGLLNRTSFLAQAENSLVHGGSSAGKAAILMLDLDHFKNINDTYGHSSGDLVLTTFADIVRQHIKDQDYAGRLGGEEFAIFLNDCGTAEAMSFAQRLGHALAEREIPLEDGRVIRATVSIGLATWDSSTSAAEASRLSKLLKKADEALYRAKSDGRNRVQGCSTTAP